MLRVLYRILIIVEMSWPIILGEFYLYRDARLCILLITVRDKARPGVAKYYNVYSILLLKVLLLHIIISGLVVNIP
jgi:hypothetical protein